MTVFLARQHRRGNRDLAHVLHATGNHEVARAAHHRLGRKVHRLLGAAALAIDGRSRHLVGQAGCQPTGARNVTGLWTDSVNATENHVFDGGGINVVTIHQRAQAVRAQVGRVHLAQAATAPSDGRSQCIYYVCFGHVVSPLLPLADVKPSMFPARGAQ